MTGASVSETSRVIREQFQSSAYAARRLVRTETNFIANQAEMDTYKSLGVEEYQYIATLDTRTSKLCQRLDGQVFSLEDAKAGVNYPPMHPNCRSTTIAYDADDQIERRAAKDENGNRIEVPGNMKYSEWLEKYHPELTPNIQQFRSVRKGNEVFSTVRKGIHIESREILTSDNHLFVSENVKLKPKALHRIDKRISQALKKLNINGAENLPKIIIVNQSEMQTTATASYVPAQNVMYVVDSLSEKDLKDLQSTFTCPGNPISTLVHELFHWQDAQKYRNAGGRFDNAQDVQKYLLNINKHAINQLDKVLDKSYNLSDISEYAIEKAGSGDFVEVYTEYRTKKALEG